MVMDAFYIYFANHFGISPLNTLLLLIIFFVAKKHYTQITETLEHSLKRIERNERSMLKAGIELLDMEE
jgi:hypothetical protein